MVPHPPQGCPGAQLSPEDAVGLSDQIALGPCAPPEPGGMGGGQNTCLRRLLKAELRECPVEGLQCLPHPRPPKPRDGT